MLSDSGRSMWRVMESRVWEVGAIGSGVTIAVPAGTLTDLASIPRGFGACCRQTDTGPRRLSCRRIVSVASDIPRTDHPAPFTRAEADKILDEAMAALPPAGGQVVEPNPQDQPWT